MIGQVGLCDSFDEDDIQELQAELQGMAGPTLRNFQLLEEEQPILSFSCIDIIRGLLDGEGKDVRLVGRDTEAALRAFLYVLLQLGEQRRSYPHLNTLIREQFYKPNIFRHQGRPPASDQSRAMLDKCLQYFQQVGDGVRIEEYLLREPLFQQACLIMLQNSLQEEEGPPLQQLARKFNIDMRTVAPQLSGECLHLGGSHYQVIRQGEYYFIAVGEGRDDLSQSKLELESIRSGESGLHLLVAPQASDQSTPKFKNSQVKFRKKSHKNSFGGDLQIVQYRDLLHLQTQKLTMNNAKVLSEYFDGNEVESCAEVLQDRTKKHSFQDIIDSQAKGKVEMKVEMKGSTTLTPQQHVDHRRNRKISSSQIIEYHRESRREEKKGTQTLPEEEDDEKQPCYNSLVVVKDEPMPRMRTSLIGQKLQRIEERQSSQRESHREEESEHSEQKQMGGDVQSHMKLKDRKYSYFTQQLASNKAKKAREVDSGNYVFRIPKNQHKNSEVILPTNDALTIRKRFQENPLRFSQLGAPSESSAQDSFLQQQRKHNPQKNLRLASSLYSYHIHYQPLNWHTKEIIYHLDNGHKEVKVVTKHRPPSPPPPLLAQPMQIISPLAAMKESGSFSVTQRPSVSIPSVVNPYELNETSFLKNRIQSMANLDPFEPDKEDTHSAVFSTCRSLRNIASPSKISFNYLPSKGLPAINAPLSPKPPTTIHTNTPAHTLTTLPLPSSPSQQTLQFRQPSMPSLHARPQTYSGFGFGHR